MDTTLPIQLQALASDVGISLDQVERAVELLDDGNTVPFITLYRKDETGGLDEEQVRAIQTKLAAARHLVERKQTILKSIESQGKLTKRLAKAIRNAPSTKRLEDLYLPFKPKKRTLAEQARQRGLEGLAREVLENDEAAQDLNARAASFVSPEHQLDSVDDVLAGVGHLIAEHFGESADLRERLRKTLKKSANLVCCQGAAAELQESTPAPEPPPTSTDPVELPSSQDQEELKQVTETGDEATSVPEGGATAASSAEGAEDEAAREEIRAKRRAARKSKKEQRRKRLLASFKDYFGFEERLSKMPHHRVLAINRGEKTRMLRVKLGCDMAELTGIAEDLLVDPNHTHVEILKSALQDALARLVVPSLEREMRRELTEAAESHAVRVFALNLRKLLLQLPVRNRRVLAIDPGFKSGCNVAVIDEFGTPVAHEVVYVIGKDEQIQQAGSALVKLLQEHDVSTIAIGTGTASRDVEQLVAGLIEKELEGRDVAYVMVNQAGASEYSTSELGREELPDLDPVFRSAISIGRRLLDPLSELVKINPSNIGVGLYQHDMKAKHLRESLDAVVESCVNYVGVDVNAASPALLGYVSGLNQLKARHLYDYRKEHGPFKTREQLKQVPNIGEATFVQAAGFLKITDGDNPLDGTSIHPESYEVAQAVLARLGATVEDIRKQTSSAGESTISSSLAEGIAAVDVNAMSKELNVGEMTLRDILAGLTRPNRDPREDFPPPVFRRGIMKLDDLAPGMELAGTVQNVVDFGAFVDIGLPDSGLVHVSRLANDYVNSPHDVVSVGDTLRLWVLEIDKDRRRVSLTAIPPGTEEERPVRDKQKRARSRGKERPQNRKETKKRRTHTMEKKKIRKPHKPKPVKPITPEMQDGTEPMRTFSDLLQFYDKKNDGSKDQQ